MDVIDNRTPAFELPLPHPEQPDAAIDAMRIRQALQLIDQLLSGLADGLGELTGEGGGLDLNLLPPNVRALAGLAGAADRAPYFTAPNTLALAVQTAFGRNWMAAADSAAGRVALLLGSAATANVTASATDVTAGRLLKVGDFGLPTDPQYKVAPAATTIDPNADWNAINKAGFFGALLGGAAGARNPNHPDGQTPLGAGNGVTNYYWAMAATYGGNYCQLALPYVSGVNNTLATPKFRLKGGEYLSPWYGLHHSGNQFSLGPDQATALTALGLTGLPARVAALEGGQTVTALGDVATTGAQTVDLNVTAGKFFTASMATASATGTLTLNFTNVPVSETSIITWHVELIRGARKTLVLQLDGVTLTPTWSGGAAPLLSAAATGRDLLMFYRMPGRATVYAMLVDSGTV
ncbi:hypothetical protein [Pseudomonas paralcaligenes]|uniref:hypothetical protein n=1 Tax=Pseudomonas paralcaligenes TaxID=2772558 RepID=UPI001C82542C|nr:hypothetical protein [Pseudomonas paralcaligenes]